MWYPSIDEMPANPPLWLRRRRRVRIMLAVFRVLIALLFLGGLIAWCSPPAHAGQIPAAAHQYQRDLTRMAQQEFGLAAPVALFAAQIHQESAWRPDARSPYAYGLAQFTPDTAAWIVEAYPDLYTTREAEAAPGGENPAGVGAAPYSPTWAMRAMLRYNKHLLDRVKPWYARDVPRCDRWAFALAGYNGGPGWLPRDRRLAYAGGADPDLWWGHVEHYTARADWAREENRGYPRRILWDLEPRYLQAGWHGRQTCH
ncbi:MAG: transglycosylase SLT domain-containing protein [Aquisalimonadaceae bacterium]